MYQQTGCVSFDCALTGRAEAGLSLPRFVAGTIAVEAVPLITIEESKMIVGNPISLVVHEGTVPGSESMV